MGMLMYGLKEKREQEKQAQAKNTLQHDLTANGRSAIRRQPTIHHYGSTFSDRQSGRTSPRSVRLSLRNYDVTERDGEVILARRPPGSHPLGAEPASSSQSVSRRTHRADVEDRLWSTAGSRTGSAQTLADLAALDRTLPPGALRRFREGNSWEADLERLNRLHDLTMMVGMRQEQDLRESQFRTNALLNEVENFRRAASLTSATQSSPSSRDHERSERAQPVAPGLRQVPAYNELTIDARRDLDQIMGFLPPTTRVDGLGDRVRSPSPGSDSDGVEDAWETLQTTITPDERLPSLESSFNTSTAESVAPVSERAGSQGHSSSSSAASRETGADTTATSPSIAGMESVPRPDRLPSPGCDEEDTRIGTPESLPELVRVERVRSPAASVRPEHVQGEAVQPNSRQPDRSTDASGIETNMVQYFHSRLDGSERRNRPLDTTLHGSRTPAPMAFHEPNQERNQSGHTLDEARRDLECALEEFSRSRMHRLAEFLARGDSESIPDEFWQALVPRNVIAGAVGEDNER